MVLSILSLFFLLSLFGSAYSDTKLPYHEVEALRVVMMSLRLMSAAYRIPSNNCPSQSSSIICNCSYPGNVCHVTEIKIDDTDSIGGVIDDQISKLKYLKVLNLGNGQLSGNIPESLGGLQELETLNLRKNLLTGVIPASLGKLSSLKTLKLHGNALVGSIPRTLGNLTNLEILRLEQNQLNGSIPTEIGKLTNLNQLRLEDNQLNGTLPLELGNLINLIRFDVSSNYLTGKLSHSYSKLASLDFFSVAGNYLSGQIPTFIANWTNLTNLYLIGNEFEGNLPPEIFNMPSLQFLLVSDLRNSSFSFPEHANLTNIYTLVLRNCSITGGIPSYIGNWSSLKYLDLSFNKLTGEIPESFKNLQLNEMFLARNLLNGTISEWMPHIIQSKGDLSDNNFTTTAGTEFHQNLKFHPTRNEFKDMNKLCKSKSKYHSLFINCGGPELKDGGKKYDEDTATSSFFLNTNANWAYSCTGDSLLSASDSSDFIQNIGKASDKSLNKSARLCPVSLTYYAWCLRNDDYNVKLQFVETNSRSWKRVFDVYVQGTRRLQDFDIKQDAAASLPVTVSDNLLEINLYWAGKGSIYNPPAGNGPLLSAISMTPCSHSKKLSPFPIAGITVGAVLTPLLILAFIWKMGWLRNKELDEITIKVNEETSYTVRQIINATRNFSPQMMIGKGNFGEAYQARMPDGMILAVKKLSTHLTEQNKVELKREIVNLTCLRHENLVQLFGCYSKKHLHLLVYEYMENGSLHQALFEDGSSRKLGWEARVGICLGIAKGLKYLHEEIGGLMKIVHGNIKPTNIMLDKRVRAKLSDFGFATFCDDDPFLLFKQGRSRSYMAPELFSGAPITVKADVFSLGVVMLEIVSGKQSMEYDPAGGVFRYLLDTAFIFHESGRMMDLVEDSLATNDDQAHEALAILKIAMQCINLHPSSRPTMSEIVIELEKCSSVNAS